MQAHEVTLYPDPEETILSIIKFMKRGGRDPETWHYPVAFTTDDSKADVMGKLEIAIGGHDREVCFRINKVSLIWKQLDVDRSSGELAHTQIFKYTGANPVEIETIKEDRKVELLLKTLADRQMGDYFRVEYVSPDPDLTPKLESNIRNARSRFGSRVGSEASEDV